MEPINILLPLFCKVASKPIYVHRIILRIRAPKWLKALEDEEEVMGNIYVNGIKPWCLLVILELLYSGSACLPSSLKHRKELRKCLLEWQQKFEVKIYEEEYEIIDENVVPPDNPETSQSKKLPSAKIRIPPDILMQDYEKAHNNTSYGDIIIVVNNIEFHLHRVILYSHVPFFAAMLCSSWNDRTIPNSKFIIDINAKVFPVALQYIYTGSIPKDLDGNTILRVMIESERLGLSRLQQLCIAYISARISHINCITLHTLAQQHGIRDLEKVCDHYFKHYQSKYTTKEFSTLSSNSNSSSSRLILVEVQ